MEQNIPDNVEPAVKVGGARVAIPQNREKKEGKEQNEKVDDKENQIVEKNDENELIKSFGIHQHNFIETPKKFLEKETRHAQMKPLPTREPCHQAMYLKLHQPKQD